jgi:hypothetical protein
MLLVDDFAMASLSDDERRSFLEVCDDRYGRRLDQWARRWGDFPLRVSLGLEDATCVPLWYTLAADQSIQKETG